MSDPQRQDLVECQSIYGGSVLVPKGDLAFRLSAYAVILHRGRLLVLASRSNEKLAFPGGGIERGELVADALRREVREETGLEIEIAEFLCFKEHFFYYDPKHEAFHSFLLYYRCRPLSFQLLPDQDVVDDESTAPRWIPLEDLEPDAFFGPNAAILGLLKAGRAP